MNLGQSLRKTKEVQTTACLDSSHCSFETQTTSTPPVHIKIGQWLIAQGWISPDQLSVALKEQCTRSKRLGELMIDLGFITPDQLRTALSALSGLPSICLSNLLLDIEVVGQLSHEMALHYQAILFQRDQDTAHVAMADPDDLLAIDKLTTSLGSGVTIITYHTTENDIAEALEIYYPQKNIELHESEIVRLVNAIILKAVRLKASDIHISPNSQTIDIYYRLDGLLHLVHTLHKDQWSALIVRLKIMASCDIAESRRPQQGRFSLSFAGRQIDFRFACHPIIHGEKIVIRILDQFYALRPLDALGFHGDDVQLLKKLSSLPHGMILFTGPTGAGKTTTLYALLNYMDCLSRNIMTLEEPVEYILNHIHQTKIREQGPMGFDDGIRSLLRQDPDVIFVSEIRDHQTAQMALRASMTGHLVLGTIHAQDCYSIPHRLTDLGISPSEVGSYITAGISQRLIRRLCEQCRYPQIISQEERKRFSLADSISHVYQAGSCPACFHTGYYGREAIVEVAIFDEHLSALIKTDTTPHILREIGKENGLSGLWKRAVEKVVAGKTTFAELDRVIGVNL